MTKFLYATLTATMILISVTTSGAFAQTDFTTIEGNEIKNNPISQDILKKISISKNQFERAKEIEQKKTEQKKFVDEQRALAQKSLNLELQRMEKKYEEFTPENAFARYVSGLNSTHYGIFWDQFDYLNAKVSLARDARDTVLKHGGTYTDAMKQYVKFAKMPKIEMLNLLRDLNLKHGFAQEETQSNFDIDGKLPRYENDLEAPCYGCTAKITKVQVGLDQTVPIKYKTFEPKPTKAEDLQSVLSNLQKTFLESKDVTAQMKVVSEMNEIVRQIHELK